MAKILVADDEPKLGKVVAEALELDGHWVVRVGGGKAALVELAASAFEIVISDLRMPEVDGLAVLREARARNNPPAVMLMTAFGSTENAVEAMKLGAADYVTKPFSVDELRIRVRRLAEKGAAERKTARLVTTLQGSLVAESPAMKQVLQAAKQVAATDATVLLVGESGTGKSQLARWIHYAGKRAASPLIEVHAAALPETLLESELFGHEKGAFTGADQRREGQLAAADGGTLFLDEIGEVTMATQVKLLRFLQEREFVAVGSTQTRKVDVRVIAATNRELAEAVKQGRFRQDFYYRLNVFTIEVPPLRSRREDIIPIARRLLASRGLPPSKLSSAAEGRLLEHGWPGNVRELENALERGLILSGPGPIEPQHLSGTSPAGVGTNSAGEVLRPGFNLDQFERDLIHAAIERAGGNKAAAARLLGITRRRLYSRLESLDAKVSEDEQAS